MQKCPKNFFFLRTNGIILGVVVVVVFLRTSFSPFIGLKLGSDEDTCDQEPFWQCNPRSTIQGELHFFIIIKGGKSIDNNCIEGSCFRSKKLLISRQYQKNKYNALRNDFLIRTFLWFHSIPRYGLYLYPTLAVIHHASMQSNTILLARGPLHKPWSNYSSSHLALWHSISAF